MRILPYALAAAVSFALASPAAGQIERRLERTFKVSADSLVSVRLSGGSINTVTGGSGTVEVRLTQTVRNVSSDREADDILADYEVSAIQQGDQVTVIGQRKNRNDGGWFGRRPNVSINATLTVPANVRLDLDTSGGSITARGDRTASLSADTSGGSITIDGGRGTMTLDTSGGGIRVGQVLGTLRAETSGGGITVEYVGASATDVSLDTSGGSITVGVDRTAKLNLTADTSGGSVDIDGLDFRTEGRSLRRSHASGTINGGGGRLSAETSGGSIHIRAANR